MVYKFSKLNPFIAYTNTYLCIAFRILQPIEQGNRTCILQKRKFL